MSIAPVIKSVQVRVEPERAFTLFATQMELWWPRGMTVAKQPHATIVLEPRSGGRWFERDADGLETQWGQVLAWEPPSRLLLGWQLNSQWTYDPDFITEVELTFDPAPGGGALVTLEHRQLERFGADAGRIAGQVGEGWPKFLGYFAKYADAQA